MHYVDHTWLPEPAHRMSLDLMVCSGALGTAAALCFRKGSSGLFQNL